MRVLYAFLAVALLLFSSCKEEKKMSADDYFKEGVKAYKEGDLDEALEYFKNGCKLKNHTSCLGVATIYLDKNLIEESIYYYDKACAYGDKKVCNFLAKAYYNGRDIKGYEIKPNIKKTLHYYKIACNHDDSKSCAAVGNILVNVFGKKYKALKYFQKSCNLGYGDGCKAYRVYRY